jgi:hypothetical protein
MSFVSNPDQVASGKSAIDRFCSPSLVAEFASDETISSDSDLTV